MTIKRTLRTSIGFFLAFNLLLSFGAISLLDRMTPAIQRLFQENVVSLKEVEEMLVVLAGSEGQPLAPESASRFADAFARAKANITERDEAPLIAEMESLSKASVAGNVQARRRTVEALHQVAQINRQAMQDADREAVRLGTAGAWSIVLLGFAGFAIGLVLFARLNRHVVAPIHELSNALFEWKESNPRRRCGKAGAPSELRYCMSVINQLLDERASDSGKSRSDNHAFEADRAIVLHLLEREAGPALVVDAKGEIVAANNSALTRLSEDDGDSLRAALAGALAGQPSGAVKRMSEVKGTGYRYCELG